MASAPGSSTCLSTEKRRTSIVQKKPGDTVIIAMDGSEYSDYALQFYMDTIHEPLNNVIIVHSTDLESVTIPVNETTTADAHANMMTEGLKAEEMKANELVDILIQKLKNLKIEGTIERVHGAPGPAIIKLANEKHADYIVVGCRGKGLMRRTFTGSVTDYVSNHSNVPVIVARHKDHIKQ